MTCKDVAMMLLAFPKSVKVVTYYKGKVMPCFDAHRIVETHNIKGVEVGSGVD